MLLVLTAVEHGRRREHGWHGDPSWPGWVLLHRRELVLLSVLLHRVLSICFGEREFAARVLSVDANVEHPRLPCT